MRPVTPLLKTALAAGALSVLGVGCTFFDDAAPPPGDVTLTTATSLVVIEEEPPGEDCPTGGQRVITGLDANGDDVLGADEVEGEGLVCNGADGAMGTTLDDLACEGAQTPVFDGAAWTCQPLVVDTDTDTLASLECVDGQLAKWSGDAWACAADNTADPGTDTLANLTCGVDQVAKYNGASWFCSEDANTVTVNTDTLAMLPCANGEVPKRMGSGWVCGLDLDTTVANTDTLADLSCTGGEVAKYNGTTWACGVDLDTTVANTDTLAGLSCTGGEVAKYSGTAWACAADEDTTDPNTDTLAGLSCASGDVPSYNGTAWACSPGGADTLAGLSCASGDVASYDGTAWVCSPGGADTLAGLSCASGDVPSYDGNDWVCIPGGADTLAGLSCTTDEIAKYNGTAWACAVDVDTTDPNTDTLADLTCNTDEIAKYNGTAWACAVDDNDDTTLDATTLWQLGGNATTTPGTDYLGTSNDVALELHVNGSRALLLVPDATSPSVVGGHPENTVGGAAIGAAIGGGGETGAANFVYDPYGVVAGGADNVAGIDDMATTESYATVGGGLGNTASGDSATVPGGLGNVASGDSSFAAGTQAMAIHDGAIVLADSTPADFSSSAADEFAVRANGGVRFEVNGFEVTLDEATGLWSSAVISDRAAKHALTDVDAEEVLARLDAIDIGAWAYNGRDERHLGPMAQDFHAAFGLGDSEKRIHPLDAAGVSLKAIQALSARTEALLEQNRLLAEQNAALEARLARLEATADEGGQ